MLLTVLPATCAEKFPAAEHVHQLFTDAAVFLFFYLNGGKPRPVTEELQERALDKFIHNDSLVFMAFVALVIKAVFFSLKVLYRCIVSCNSCKTYSHLHIKVHVTALFSNISYSLTRQ